MKERINRLARGILDGETPKVVVMPEKIEETVQAKKMIVMEFHVNSGNGMHIKGLAYTSHTRVTVLTPAFGGLRNRVSYQVDTSYLENGDVIEGGFDLVTDGGEIRLPFTFHIQLGASGKTLAGLRTVEDLALLAKAEPETALRLFHYQDFGETHILQDRYNRAVYDGLKGHGDRGNQMEEFLVALKAKEPVTLTVSGKRRKYGYPVDPVEDAIQIRKDRWGYISVEAQADGDFLELPKKHFENGDFKEDSCMVPYRILPGRLHRGKNLGCIRLNTVKETWIVPFEVEGDETTDAAYVDQSRFRRAYCRFLKLRLDEACGAVHKAAGREPMFQELDVMRSVPGDKVLAALWMAETLIRSGKREPAGLLLDECRDEILMARKDHVEQYCFFQYLSQLIWPNESQKASLLRLVQKYLLEGGHPFLSFIRLELDEEARSAPLSLLSDMRQLYEEGLRSPFLYLKAFQILKEHPKALDKLDDLEIRVLYFAARKKIVDQELALQTAKLAGEEKHYQKWIHRLLVLLYEEHPKQPILEGICSMMIKGECRGREDFRWYELALEKGVSLTRLYEHYLYSLPEDYGHLLPKEVLLYFTYGHDLDDRARSVLYQNILQYMAPSSKLYQEYERDMEQFAMDQLFQSKIDSHLAVIYDRMILKDMIDEPVAKVLPAVLRSFKIACGNRQMKYVIVRYEELSQEDMYLLTDGVAYVPLYSDRPVILFQDAYGNRYSDVRYTKTPVMAGQGLEERCFAVAPEHPMLSLAACRQIAGAETMERGQVRVLERALRELPVNTLYRKALLAKVIDYYRKQAGDEDSGECECSYLLTLDAKAMTQEERLKVCETLISQDYLEESYKLLRNFGWEGMDVRRLSKLCRKLILKKLFKTDVFLLKLAFQAFDKGATDAVLLDFLCGRFNGSSRQMFKLLSQSVSARAETYDLEERLLCQMMFSGDIRHLDQTFRFYSRRKVLNETVLRAYFTVRSIGYFLKHEMVEDDVFAYLEATVNQTDDLAKVPMISLLALTKHYSECRTLEGDQKALCRRVTELLLEEGLVFPYTKKLSAFIPIPHDILDKAMVCYEGNKDDDLELEIRIAPDEAQPHREVLQRIYQGIFVCKKVLFEGETLEYTIYKLDKRAGKRTKVAEGTVSCELPEGSLKESRYASLNEMGLCLGMKEEAGLKRSMQEYLVKSAALEELFPLAK